MSPGRTRRSPTPRGPVSANLFRKRPFYRCDHVGRKLSPQVLTPRLLLSSQEKEAPCTDRDTKGSRRATAGRSERVAANLGAPRTVGATGSREEGGPKASSPSSRGAQPRQRLSSRSLPSRTGRELASDEATRRGVLCHDSPRRPMCLL